MFILRTIGHEFLIQLFNILSNDIVRMFENSIS
jgi:hypothetical protein